MIFIYIHCIYLLIKNLYNISRYTFNENRLASKKLQQKYDDKIIGKIANAIYNYHKDKSIMYELYAECEVVYKEIVEKYNDIWPRIIPITQDLRKTWMNWTKQTLQSIRKPLTNRMSVLCIVDIQ